MPHKNDMAVLHKSEIVNVTSWVTFLMYKTVSIYYQRKEDDIYFSMTLVSPWSVQPLARTQRRCKEARWLHHRTVCQPTGQRSCSNASLRSQECRPPHRSKLPSFAPCKNKIYVTWSGQANIIYNKSGGSDRNAIFSSWKRRPILSDGANQSSQQILRCVTAIEWSFWHRKKSLECGVQWTRKNDHKNSQAASYPSIEGRAASSIWPCTRVKRCKLCAPLHSQFLCAVLQTLLPLACQNDHSMCMTDHMVFGTDGNLV